MKKRKGSGCIRTDTDRDSGAGSRTRRTGECRQTMYRQDGIAERRELRVGRVVTAVIRARRCFSRSSCRGVCAGVHDPTSNKGRAFSILSFGLIDHKTIRATVYSWWNGSMRIIVPIIYTGSICTGRCRFSGDIHNRSFNIIVVVIEAVCVMREKNDGLDTCVSEAETTLMLTMMLP